MGEGALVGRREFAATLVDGVLGLAYLLTRVVAMSVIWAVEGRKR